MHIVARFKAWYITTYRYCLVLLLYTLAYSISEMKCCYGWESESWQFLNKSFYI